MKNQKLIEQLLLLGVQRKEILRVQKKFFSGSLSNDIPLDTIKDICKELNLPINSISLGDDSYYNDSCYKIRQTENLGEKVISLLDEQHKKYSELVEYLEKTSSGVNLMFKRNTCNIDTLQRIAMFFSVDVGYFLPPKKTAEEKNKIRELELENLFLRGKIAAFESMLHLLSSSIKEDKELSNISV